MSDTVTTDLNALLNQLASCLEIANAERRNLIGTGRSGLESAMTSAAYPDSIASSSNRLRKAIEALEHSA